MTNFILKLYSRQIDIYISIFAEEIEDKYFDRLEAVNFENHFEFDFSILISFFQIKLIINISFKMVVAIKVNEIFVVLTLVLMLLKIC